MIILLGEESLFRLHSSVLVSSKEKYRIILRTTQMLSYFRHNLFTFLAKWRWLCIVQNITTIPYHDHNLKVLKPTVINIKPRQTQNYLLREIHFVNLTRQPRPLGHLRFLTMGPGVLEDVIEIYTLFLVMKSVTQYHITHLLFIWLPSLILAKLQILFCFGNLIPTCLSGTKL